MTALPTRPNILRRIIAALIDYSLIFVFLYVFVTSFGELNSEGEYTVKGWVGFVPMLFGFVMLILTEVILGATVGNSIVGLKPISLTRSNGKLTIGQSLKRHLLDPIDMLAFGLIGIITIKKTDRNQRLGDIWAETIVTEIKQKQTANI